MKNKSLWKYYQKGSFSFERPFGRRKSAWPRRITFLIPLLVLVAAPAHALDVGACDTPEGLSAKLKAEGHKIVATMERVGVSLEQNRATGTKGVARGANLLTATPNLTRWYMVRSYAPLGARPDRMCISAAGRNLEINDHRKNVKPTVTPLRFDVARAKADCQARRNEESNCVDYASMVVRMNERFGERIAVQGVSDQGGLITIVANPGKSRHEGVLGDQDFGVLSTTPSGATVISLFGDKFGFSKWVLAVLDSR